jgi:hypothetical protein
MKYLDTAVQTLLILGAAGAAIAGIFERDMFLLFAVAQFWLGVWQVAGCIISLIVYPDQNDLRRRHIALSAVYVATLFALGAFPHQLEIPKWLIIGYGTVPAWSLGIYYYRITLRWAFPQLKQGKFLPHISF